MSIKLSNLRRLITASMPAFFLFIEFDGENSAQRAFIVHVDEDLVSRALKRIHELEQVDGVNDYNKRSMTIHYGVEHELFPLGGHVLKSKIKQFVGDGMAAYVARKNKHLALTGFENGRVQATFSTEGEENLKNLIDALIGEKKSVSVKDFKGFHTRFGIKNKSPIFDSEEAKLEITDLEPAAMGLIRFREDSLSPSLTFSCKLFSSPLNKIVPKEHVKMRFEGDFFDLSLNPYTGAAEYRFNVEAGARFAINTLRDAIRLLYLMTSSAKNILVEMSFNELPSFGLSFNGQDQPFSLFKELNALDSAIKIGSYFEMSDSIQVSLEEISKYAESISQFHAVLHADGKLFKVGFGMEGDGFDSSKSVACIFLTTTKIGSRVFGAIFVVTGKVSPLDDGRYCLLGDNVSIDRRLVSDEDGIIRSEDLIQAIELVERKYEPDFEVVTMFDKTGDRSQDVIDIDSGSKTQEFSRSPDD